MATAPLPIRFTEVLQVCRLQWDKILKDSKLTSVFASLPMWAYWCVCATPDIGIQTQLTFA